MSNPSSVHPLLRLVNANKNSLKCALVKYIDVTVERQFGQLRNRLVQMIESGETVLGDVNASNNNDDDDDYSESDEGEIISEYAECEDCAKGICGLDGENGDAQDARNVSKNTQINTHQGTQPNGQVASGSNLTNVNTNVIEDNQHQSNNIGISSTIQRQQANGYGEDQQQNNDNRSNTKSIPSSVFYSNEQYDQITLHPPTNTASMDSGHLIPDVIDDSNQSTNDNASNDLSIFNNEKQIRTVRKSKKNVPTKQQKSVQSVQPEHDHQSIPSTSSGRRSSGRKRTSTKLFFNDQSCGQLKKKNKRKSSTTELSKAVKKVKPGTGDDTSNGVDDDEDDGDNEFAEKSKERFVILELKCIEPGCKTISDSVEMWRQHLSTVHGQTHYTQFEHNVRQNQLGKLEFPCTECVTVCRNLPSIYAHWRIHHQQGKFKCGGCEFVGNTRDQVSKHQHNDHQPITRNGTEVGKGLEKAVILKLDCIKPGCKTILNTLEMWKQHLASVHSQMQPYKHLKDNVRKNQSGKWEYACTECEVVRSNVDTMSVHWKKLHQKGEFKCCDCEFVGNLRQEVYEHRKTSHKKDKDSLNRGEDL